MITFVAYGDLFESGADILVNATNTDGIMGAGIALAFKNRFPKYHEIYVVRCALGLEKVAHVVPSYAETPDGPIIVSLHTINSLRNAEGPKKILDHTISGLHALRHQLTGPLIHKSIAIPALGCGIGGLRWETVKHFTAAILDDLPNDIKVYNPH